MSSKSSFFVDGSQMLESIEQVKLIVQQICGDLEYIMHKSSDCLTEMGFCDLIWS